MKLSDIFRILKRNFVVLIFFSFLLAGLVFFKTIDEEKEYTSSFLVYTGIASGYDLNTEEHPRLDHNAVNNAFDNLLTTLKARETMEEVGVRLLVMHLRMKEPDEVILSSKNFYRIKNLVPDSIENKIQKAKDVEVAVSILYEYNSAPGNNAVKALLASGYEIYGFPFISSKLNAARKGFSDMLEISYSANDPGVCQQTLLILSDVFIRRYKEIKKGEINNVVSYFEKQVQQAREKLKSSEDRLRQFEVENKIINYDEQTKSISASKQQLIESIQKERLIRSSAEATVRNLETKLNFRKGLMETNDKILSKRQKLAELNYKIANGHLYEDKPQELEKIKAEAESIKEEIRIIVNDLYQINNSTEGLPRNDLMTQWLNNLLVLDESTARLKIMEARQNEFEGLYSQYAPLGSTLTRLKREIEVAEKEYLDILDAYNVNKQHQQNIELATNVRIVDKPYYPTEPKASKRMVLVAGSFIGGFFFAFSILFAMEFFNNKVKTPTRAEQLTGLKLAGALPYVRKKEKRFDVEYLENSLIEQTISTVILEIRQSQGTDEGILFLMVSSAKEGEGKSWFSYKIASRLSEIKGRGLLLYPENIGRDKSDAVKEFSLGSFNMDIMTYSRVSDFVNKSDVMDLPTRKKINLEKYSFVIIEIPALSENQLPIDLVRKMNLCFLVLRADRVWSETDNYVTKLYRRASTNEPMLLLNRVSPDGLKEIFGGIPKKKKIMKEIKQLGPPKNEEEEAV